LKKAINWEVSETISKLIWVRDFLVEDIFDNSLGKYVHPKSI
jgi:hypothetical protein